MSSSFVRTKKTSMAASSIAQSDDVTQCLKLITRGGCERIVRYAFEYARRNSRKKVTCFTKDNIMKITDGLFHKVFDEIAAEYTDIENEHWIVDIGAAKLADTPEAFDVVVMPNLYGDVLSDVAAQIAGSVGLAGSANIGANYAMFEAIHGSAPRRAGQNLANPSGLLLGGIMMLVHIGQTDVAERVHNAWLRTLEDGVHTYDIYTEGISKQKVGTKEFAQAVVARLGQKPEKLKAVSYKAAPPQERAERGQASTAKKQLVGVDVFVDWTAGTANDLGAMMESLPASALKLDHDRQPRHQGLSRWFPGDDHLRYVALPVHAGGDNGIQPSQIIDLLEPHSGRGCRFHQVRESVQLRRPARILARPRA